MRGSENQEYSIVIRSSRVTREIGRLPNSDRRRIDSALRSLSENPRRQGALRLQGGMYRFRVGNFRILYRIDDSARSIVLGAVRRRNEGTYRGIERLF